MKRKRRKGLTILLREEKNPILPTPLIYRLYADGTRGACRYWMTVIAEDEQGEMELGSDICEAISRFRGIAGGGVTPCTLPDIEADMLYEMSMA